MELCAKGYHRRKPSYGHPKVIETAVKENLLDRLFSQDTINAIWVTDMTTITFTGGRLYLSTYIDLATRIPRCFKGAYSMKKFTLLDPLHHFKGSFPSIIHSDRVSQYHSFAFQNTLESDTITHSLSEPKAPEDNAIIESFHRFIKRTWIIPNKHKLMAEMKGLIHDYLSEYYPNKRIHTKFKMTPKQFEENRFMSSNSLQTNRLQVLKMRIIEQFIAQKAEYFCYI